MLLVLFVLTNLMIIVILIFWLNSENGKLFISINRSKSNNKKCGIVMCYPFAEARLRVHRLYKSLAEYFCSSGYDVIRFDYWGQGDSDGEFVESSIETMGKDTNFIISYFRKAFSLNKIILFI